MNYIELINRFWQCDREYFFTPTDTRLYFKLLDACNRLGWKNPFRYSNRRLAADCGISENTLVTSRNHLKNAGLLNFDSGKQNRELTAYSLETTSKSEVVPAVHPAAEAKVQAGTVALHIIKQKKTSKKTKNECLQQTLFPPKNNEILTFFYTEKLAAWGAPKCDREAASFFNFYQSKGWMVGQNPMKDWQAAALRWMLKTDNPVYETTEKPAAPAARKNLHSGGKKHYNGAA